MESTGQLQAISNPDLDIYDQSGAVNLNLQTKGNDRVGAVYPTFFPLNLSPRFQICYIFRIGGSIFHQTWIPYKGQSSNARLSEKDKNIYTIKAVSFSKRLEGTQITLLKSVKMDLTLELEHLVHLLGGRTLKWK
ncbi:Uncharacterized protein Fot_24738 [Forsythia ovata]|uniref:Uncharacterized protein n=1 Tax=Forsythia ovata TaxID=205694 RepID=A0ABD1U721_9LAMI